MHRVRVPSDRSPGADIGLKFLIDHQLPPSLARLLERELGQEALHVREIGLREASDAEVWRYLSESGRVLISKDEDFTAIVRHRPGAALIWVRVGNCRRDYLLNLFRENWPRMIELLQSGQRLIELR
jgi:predicted nuclease of predicted toxin-antitoxin system